MTADLVAPLRDHARTMPDRIALSATGAPSTTFGQLVEALDHAVAQLQSFGVGPTSRVATVLPNAPSTALAILSIASCSAVVPINPAFPAEEMRRVLVQAGATHVVTDAMSTTVAEELSLPVIRLVARPTIHAAAFELSGEPQTLAGAPIMDEPTRVALVLHTSGSTGTPKRVPLSVSNLACSARNVAASLQLGESDVCLNMMPMFHIGALVDLLLAPLSAGGAVAFAEAISANAFFAGLRAFNPSWFQAVPTVLRDILARRVSSLELERVRRLRFIRVVSQPLPPKLHQEFEDRFGVTLVPMFGMTETAGLIASAPLERGRQRPGSVGLPSGARIRIIDELGNEAQAGRRGEVLVGGPTVMAGYEGAVDRAASFRGEWLRSGDEGYLDDDGFLFLTGRLKDIVNRGGEKISPAEIDLLLADHPGIREAAAFPMPHPTLGEEVALSVVRSDPALGHREITDYLRPLVADFKLPRIIHFVDELPRLPSGKLDRLGLRLLNEVPVAGPRTPPSTPAAKMLADAWKTVLQRSDDIALEDDFFDLGGDSLSATNLVSLLDARFGRDMPYETLFDEPTLGAMAAILARGAEARIGATELDPALHDAVRKVTVSWRGKRAHGNSLIVGRNTLGTRRPFFWVSQSQSDFESLAAHMDAERPFHAMTSLSATGLKTDANTAALARSYAREIVALQPDGAYLLGGFCQGGVVAFEIAKALRAMGREVALLVLYDRFIPEPYDGEVALVFSRRGFFCAYSMNPRPSRAWSKFYSGPVSEFPTNGDHGDLLAPPHVEGFARSLEAQFARIDQGGQPSQASLLKRTSPLDPRSFQSRVTARVPLLMRQGSARSLKVSVTNRSPVAWAPTEESGIVLCARWRGLDLRHSHALDTGVVLDRQVAPGATIDLDLPIRVPMRGLPMIIYIDLVEDGLHWFGNVGKSGTSAVVFPLPPA